MVMPLCKSIRIRHNICLKPLIKWADHQHLYDASDGLHDPAILLARVVRLTVSLHNLVEMAQVRLSTDLLVHQGLAVLYLVDLVLASSVDGR